MFGSFLTRRQPVKKKVTEQEARDALDILMSAISSFGDMFKGSETTLSQLSEEEALALATLGTAAGKASFQLAMARFAEGNSEGAIAALDVSRNFFRYGEIVRLHDCEAGKIMADFSGLVSATKEIVLNTKHCPPDFDLGDALKQLKRNYRKKSWNLDIDLKLLPQLESPLPRELLTESKTWIASRGHARTSEPVAHGENGPLV